MVQADMEWKAVPRIRCQLSGAGVAGAAASEKAAETQSVIIIMMTITTIIMINSRSVVSAP